MKFTEIPKQQLNIKQLLFSNRDLWNLFYPLLVEQFLVLGVGLADSIMVSSLGEAAVSGVSLVDFIMMLIIFVFIALSAGGTVIAGQYLGRKDIVMAQKAADQLVWYVGLFSLAITAFAYIFKDFILGTVFGSVAPDVMLNANKYFLVVAASIPAIALFHAGSAIFKTTGDSKTSMKIVIIMNIINIAGNAFFIYVLQWDIIGVALPTTVSRYFSAIIMIFLTTRPKFILQLPRTLQHNFDWKMVKRLLNIGVPYGIENGLFQLGRIAVVSIVATYGTSAIAANAVGGMIAVFEVLPGMAINAGMATVIARCIGANDFVQAKYYTKKIIKIVFVSHFVMSILLLASMPLILKVYTLTPETTAMVWKIALWHAVFALFIWPPSFSLPMTFRAAGDVRFPMYAGIGSMLLFRIVFAYIFGTIMGIGVFGTWMAMFLDWFVRDLLFIFRYLSGKWMKYKSI